MTSQDLAYQIELATKNALLHNFDSIIGTPSYCPRCLLRGSSVRWFSEREGEWQVSRCANCDYTVKDR